ncbi:hypothetical protein CHARACLAT_007576, partial [Characodon lateralis]|nr:hypothetical protein [Characodon lateralis]
MMTSRQNLKLKAKQTREKLDSPEAQLNSTPSLDVRWSLIQVTSCALVSVGLLSSTTKGSPWFRCLGALAPMKPRVSFALQPHCVGCPLGHLVWSCEPWLQPLLPDDFQPHPLDLGCCWLSCRSLSSQNLV